MQTANKTVESLVLALASSAKLALQHRCVAVYIMGSLARGGFSETASDIDVGLLLEEPLQADDKETIDDLLDKSTREYPSVKNEVSVFWGSVDSINRAGSDHRYSPFDRLDLIDHAVLIEGTDIRHKLDRPSSKELEVEGVEIALNRFANKEGSIEFNNPGLMIAKGDLYIAKTILFPARYIYVARTGKSAGHDVSSQYYTNHYKGDDADLVSLAYQLRLEPTPDSSNGSSRVRVSLLEKGLAPLYHKFIDIYIQRMNGYGEEGLASQLGNWKKTIEPADHI